jgi:hypothetical protein
MIERMKILPAKLQLMQRLFLLEIQIALIVNFPAGGLRYILFCYRWFGNFNHVNFEPFLRPPLQLKTDLMKDKGGISVALVEAIWT